MILFQDRLPEIGQRKKSYMARTPNNIDRSELTEGVLLVNLHNKQCRFPKWEDGKLTNMRFCGKPIIYTKSYRAKHFIDTRMNKKAATSFVLNLCNDH